MARGERGKSKGYCPKHRGTSTGVHPEAPPFFYEGCPLCEAKLAEGKTTRDAGPYRMPEKFTRAVQLYRGVNNLSKKAKYRDEAAKRSTALR